MNHRPEGFEVPARYFVPAAILAVVFGSWLRIVPAEGALLFGDEFHSLREISLGYVAILTEFSANGSGLAIPLLQRILIDVFGAGPLVLRAPAWIPGLALLVASVPIVRRLAGSGPALITVWLVAANPALVFYSHFGRAYSLLAAATLWLVFELMRAFDQPERGNQHLRRAAILGGLIPWIQPVGVAAVAGAFAGALGVAILRPIAGPKPRRIGAVIASGFAGLALALVLHLPAAGSTLRFFTEKTTSVYSGRLAAIDVADVLFGGGLLAIGLAVLSTLSLAMLAIRERGRFLPIVGAVVGPLVALVIVRPFGDPYAYARYLIPALVPALIAIAIIIAGGIARGMPNESLRGILTPGLSLMLGAGIFFAGPLAEQTSQGPLHANTYLSLATLPAFDAAWDRMPAFYVSLAEKPEHERKRLRILEVPALTTRTRHLYRAYHRVHGIDTSLALYPEELAWLPEGPYASPTDPSSSAPPADYLILHLDILKEVRAYWAFVYRSVRGGSDDPENDALMQRHLHYGGPFPRPAPHLLRKLRDRLGEPIYRDRNIEVFDLGATKHQ